MEHLRLSGSPPAMQATRRPAGPDGKGCDGPADLSPGVCSGQGWRLWPRGQSWGAWATGPLSGGAGQTEGTSAPRALPPRAAQPEVRPEAGWRLRALRTAALSTHQAGPTSFRWAPTAWKGTYTRAPGLRPDAGQGPQAGRAARSALRTGPRAAARPPASPGPPGRRLGQTSCPASPAAGQRQARGGGLARTRAGRARAGPRPPRLGGDSRPAQPRAERRGTRVAAAFRGLSRGEGPGRAAAPAGHSTARSSDAAAGLPRPHSA